MSFLYLPASHKMLYSIVFYFILFSWDFIYFPHILIWKNKMEKVKWKNVKV